MNATERAKAVLKHILPGSTDVGVMWVAIESVAFTIDIAVTESVDAITDEWEVTESELNEELTFFQQRTDSLQDTILRQAEEIERLHRYIRHNRGSATTDEV